MKNTNWAERIGFILIIIGFAFMILNDKWESNPMPKIMGEYMLVGSVGLLVWALGHMKRQADEKKEKERNKLDLEN
ncbi:hypothetical protein [Tenacibaculum sp. UWU-22]|uniref:hypothetical protein n=1 Tax=Tenacibaculum sp. UWU-22 TaxID=3234187 RepID=UPI0034DB009D